MAKIGHDVIGVLRGLQKVAEAGVQLQNNHLEQIWKNSSLKELAKTSVLKVSQTSVVDPQSIVKTVTESSQRINIVLESVKGYTAHVTDREYSPPITTDKTPTKSNQVAEPNYHIQLTPLEKQILDKLNQEYEQKSTKAMNQMTNTASSVNNLADIKIMETIRKPVENITIQSKTDSKKQPKTRPSLSAAAKEREVPSSRIARMISFGSLAAGLGIGTAAEAVRRSVGLRKTKSEHLDSLFLSPENMDRIVNTLCKVRGAALKIGQLLSIQDEAIISPQLSKALERVRQSADFMPQWQVLQVLEEQLGSEWRNKLADFEIRPFAAASIGQVHWGKLNDGTEVAIKIQYPGVARGIQSDIDNLVGVLKVWNVFPEGMFIDNLVTVAKRELAWEVDYKREAECTKKYKELLLPYKDFYVPRVIDELCSEQVFTTELVEGVAIDKCFDKDNETKIFIAEKSMELILREILEFQYMQTDPNWSNFLFNEKTKQIVLLDFGACRQYSKEFMDSYVRIIKAASEGDRETVLEFSKKMGFLTGYESKAMEEAHVDAVMIFGEIFRTPGKFDFSVQRATKQVADIVPIMMKHRLCPPPEEIYSLHRKLSGTFLLCSKMKVEIACRDLFLRMYENYRYDHI